MLDKSQIEQLNTKDVYDTNGDKIGRVGRIYTDSLGHPQFATVNTGFFGMKESFVPLDEATLDADGIRVPFEKDQVKKAPNIDAEHGDLSAAEESNLYSHYGRSQDYSTWRDQNVSDAASRQGDQLRLQRYRSGSTGGTTTRI